MEENTKIMKKTQNKYQKGKIYKLVSDHTDKIYIGSTAQKYLVSRLAGHKSSYKKYLSGKKCYVTSIEILKFPDCKIILIEEYPCNSRDELRAREEYHRQLNKDICVNSKSAFGRDQELYEKYLKSEKHLEYVKKYSKSEERKKVMKKYNNKPERKEYMKQYQQTEKHKQYSRSEKRIEYNRNCNKKRLETRIKCDCGIMTSVAHKSRHIKSKYHKNMIEILNSEIMRLGEILL